MSAGQSKKKGTRFWWFLLILSTAVSITLNLWHALTIAADPALIADACQVSQTLCDQAQRVADRVSGVHPVLGIIFAIVPPVFAACLSHGLVDERVADWVKRGIIGLFAVSMATSIVSQASVMHPYGGGYLAEWAIPLVLDSSALIALYMITTRARDAAKAAQQAAEERDMEAIRAQLRPGLQRDIEARVSRDMEARIRDIEAGLRRDMEAAKERDIEAIEAAKERDIEAVQEAAERDKEACLRDIANQWDTHEKNLREQVSQEKEREFAAREEAIRRDAKASALLELAETRTEKPKALDRGESAKTTKSGAKSSAERLALAIDIIRKDRTVSGAKLGEMLGGLERRQGARYRQAAMKELGLTEADMAPTELRAG